LVIKNQQPLDREKSAYYLWMYPLKTIKIHPMNVKLFSQRSAADYNSWQIAARLFFLAGILITSSYYFLIAAKSLIKLLP
jgi:hypothetical protein